MFFWNSLAFSMIQRMLAIWSVVPLPFLKPAWTSGISWFMYCWSLGDLICAKLWAMSCDSKMNKTQSLFSKMLWILREDSYDAMWEKLSTKEEVINSATAGWSLESFMTLKLDIKRKLAKILICQSVKGRSNIPNRKIMYLGQNVWMKDT